MKLTDDLYYRKLESTSTTDLVDMIREKDKSIAELEEQLTKAKEIIKNLVEFDSSYKDDEEYQRKSELYDKMWEEAEQFLEDNEVEE